MAVVGIACPLCPNTDDVQIEKMLLDVAGLVGDGRAGGNIVWVCRGCRSVVERRVLSTDVAALVAAGVELLSEPLEDRLPWHAELARPGPPLGYDDVLDLHRLLESSSWFARMLSAGGHR